MTDSNNKKLVSEVFRYLNDARKRYEMRWYISDNFYENNHFLKQLNQLNKLEAVKWPKGVKVRPIPRAKKQLKSLVNIVLSNDPRWNIYPRPGTDLNFQDPSQAEQYDKFVNRVGHWLDDIWYFLDLKDQVRRMVTSAFKYNVGYLEIGGDNEGNIFVDAYEPYDIWHEAGISELKETSVLVKAVSRTIQQVQDALDSDGKPLYDQEQLKILQPEQRVSLADFKNIRLKEQGGKNGQISDPRIARVFLKEVWVKNGKTWDLITECQGKILREDQTGYTELPFVAYKPQEGLIYQPSPFEDLIPMNQAIDIGAAMLEGYARTTGVGRLLKPKMAKVNRILDEQGEMIEYEGPSPPTWMMPGPTPGVIVDGIELMRQLQDEVGTAVVSFGKVPKGVKAAQALESLKSSEYASNADSIGLLEKSLEEAAEKIMDFGDKFFTEPVTIPHMGADGKPDPFQLVSSNSVYAANSEFPGVKLSNKFMVKVQIESGMAHTEQAKQDSVMNLYKEGALPIDEVLKAYKFTNVGDIIQKLQDQKAQGVSIVQTPEFQQLPPEVRLQILKALGVQVPEQPTGPPVAA